MRKSFFNCWRVNSHFKGRKLQILKVKRQKNKAPVSKKTQRQKNARTKTKLAKIMFNKNKKFFVQNDEEFVKILNIVQTLKNGLNTGKNKFLDRTRVTTTSPTYSFILYKLYQNNKKIKNFCAK